MNRQMCVDCKAPSPETQTHYTLIAKHGWRVVRTQGQGHAGVEWRCPSCWAIFKSRQTAHPSAPMRASRPPATASEDSVEAGKMFDRALQALTTKPPAKPPSR